ncbi:conjugal transfer protein TraN [Providencia rettgeri]|nr:conjugal transfer protein TraN [Providencia rettgeri]ELL9151406.1 conjugal transfer protein TraN [Providencia rettgeri]MBG5894596.1 conjugal transfer protein TraN [Providencia rettgeri]
MKRLLIVLCGLGAVSLGVAANDYKAGSEFANSLKNKGTNTIKNTNPANIIPNYTANPSESGYYGGVTSGAASGLENAGVKAMNDTDAGQTTMEVMKNRPPDKLDLDAPFLKAGIDMREKAESESGQITVPCQDVTLDKTEITSHQCERTPAASLACTRTAKITWEEVDGWENQTIVVPPSDFAYHWHGDRWSFSFKSPVTGTIQSATLTLNSGFLFNQHVIFMNTTFQMLNASLYTLNARNMALKEGEIIASNRICVGNNGELCRVGIQELVYQAFASTKTATLTLNMMVTVNVKTPSPKIEWVEHCPFDKSEEVKVETQCTEKGGSKTVTVGGKKYDVYSECWQYTDYYAKQSADNGSCGDYMKNPACTIVKTTCIESVGSTCLREQAVFSCEKGLTGGGKMCGVELICASGECDQIKNDKANSFQKAVSALAAVAAAGEDVAELNDVNVRAFTGQRYTCRKAAAGFNNCCKSGGWGSDVGLAHCDSEEKALGKAKSRNLTIYVGSYCSNKVLGVCLQKKEAYCVFDSKLAKIVQEQGRGGQLRIGFGSAKNSDCRGITVDELQAINFDRLNFADFYSDLESGTDIPADQELIDRVKNQIANGLQGQGGQG